MLCTAAVARRSRFRRAVCLDCSDARAAVCPELPPVPAPRLALCHAAVPRSADCPDGRAARPSGPGRAPGQRGRDPALPPPALSAPSPPASDIGSGCRRGDGTPLVGAVAGRGGRRAVLPACVGDALAALAGDSQSVANARPSATRNIRQRCPGPPGAAAAEETQRVETDRSPCDRQVAVRWTGRRVMDRSPCAGQVAVCSGRPPCLSLLACSR